MRFLETVKIVDAKVQAAGLHNQRMWTCAPLLRGFDIAGIDIPKEFSRGTVKCSLYYCSDIENIVFTPYTPRPVRRLKVVHCDDIDYSRKYADRSRLDALRSLRKDCDDVLIVKHEMVTDTTFSNICLFDGKSYVTPKSFLLDGCKRRQLLCEGKISEREVGEEDLPKYLHAKLINAMLDIEDNPFDVEIVR